MNEIDFSPFEEAIIKNNVRSRWRDSLFATNDHDRDAIEANEYLQAKFAYIQMMNSDKNDCSEAYRQWALGKSLGIAPTKAGYRSSVDGRACRR